MFSIIKEGKIKVCKCDFKTPLIWTFKFDGYEYWCPRCGYKCGMFGAGVDVDATPKIEEMKEKWKIKAKPYLSGETEVWDYNIIV
jgi:hypothetical protein